MYKTILAYLASANTAESTASTAARLAEKHGAHLIGVHNSVKLMIYGGIPQDLLAQHNAGEHKEADAIKFIFEEVAKKYAVAHEWRHKRAKDTEAFEDIVVQSRAAELVVAMGPDHTDPLGHWHDLPERLAMSSGRPVLLLPHGGTFNNLGQRVTIGWNGSKEAARATYDALPLLRNAEIVNVVTITERPDTLEQDTASLENISASLARHGINVQSVALGSTGKSAGEEILNYAADQNSTLMVMGFYGHSRLREMIWGGVTRHVLKGMDLPVLMSH